MAQAGRPPHVCVNGLSVGPGGGFTLARELVSSLGAHRPDWRFTVVLSKGNPIHREFGTLTLPANVAPLWTPAFTVNRAVRAVYERTWLVRWARRKGASAVVQLNGMVVPPIGLPTLSVHSNPMPYRSDLWTSNLVERAAYFLQRREQVRSLRDASFTLWVSDSLRRLVCEHTGFAPDGDEVVHLGLPDAYLQRAARCLPSWSTRPMEMLTVSTVVPHKRQALVIRALGLLSKRPEFESLRYRIVGACSSSHRAELERVARDAGVSGHVIIEGQVSQSRLEEAYLAARVMAFMSVCECFGLPPIEAMAFGTPSVVAESCSAREIYGDAVEYCPPDDLNALVSTLAHLLTSQRRAGELRQLGAIRVRLFSWRRAARRIAEILDVMMKEARA